MADFLIDTHIFIWSLHDPVKISPEALRTIEDISNNIYVSAAVTWEVTIKRFKGALDFTGNIVQQIYAQSFLPLSVTHQHANLLEQLPSIHSDPFDRIMIAQAIVENMVFITRDGAIAKYPNIKLLRA